MSGVGEGELENDQLERTRQRGRDGSCVCPGKVVRCRRRSTGLQIGTAIVNSRLGALRMKVFLCKKLGPPVLHKFSCA